jgi:hypothetical protein
MEKRYLFYLLLFAFGSLTFSCSNDDNSNLEDDQFLTANVNGHMFNSDGQKAPLGFSKIILPAGRISLHARVVSAEGDLLEFLVENFTGPGKYYFGDDIFNRSWIKYQRSAANEIWMIEPIRAWNLHSNFLEITTVQDNYIEGVFSCSQLKNSLEDTFGFADGEFRLKSKD